MKTIGDYLKKTRSPATFVLILIMIGVYIFTAVLSMNFRNIDPDVVLRYGSDSWHYISRGQIWRFITPAFFHYSITHLMGNLYGMLVYGTQVETLMGTGNYLILFFFTTFSATVFSNLGHLFRVSGAGASGPVYGIMGALLILAWKIRDKMGIGYLVGFAFYVGFMIYAGINDQIFGHSSVNHWAHLGGFIAGLGFAYYLYKRK